MQIFTIKKIENIVEKTQGVDYQHFLLSPQCFWNIQGR